MNDLQLAVRLIQRRPWFSAAAISALAIGLAVNTVAFSTVNGLVIKERAGFDVPGAGRIFVDGGKRRGEGVSTPEFERIAAATTGAMETAVEGRTSLAWRQDSTTAVVWALLVSRSYFSILDTHVLLGTLPATDDAARVPTAVVSERFWRDRLRAADVGGLRLVLNGVAVPVVGVLPDTFAGPGGFYAPDLWLPFEARHLFRGSTEDEREDQLWLAMIGRLATGITVPEIDARLQATASAIAGEWPRTHTNLRAHFSFLRERVPEVQLLRRVTAVGMAVVGLVLLLACFNVANLQLARAVERQREMAIRAAIGASRWRIVRQLAVEGLVLAALAGLAAVLAAAWSQRLIGSFAIPIAEPQRINVSPDATVGGFIVLMVIVAGLLPALAPALHGWRLDLVHSLSHGHTASGGRPLFPRRALMLVQIAGSTAFLLVAALFVRTVLWTATADPGFETDRTIVLTLDPAAQGYDADRSRLAVDRTLDRLRGLPGVASAAAATHLPFYTGYPRLVEIAETSQPCANGGCPTVPVYGVGPDYFHTLNVPILRGRALAAGDMSEVVVNEALAARWFPSIDPLGQVLRVGQSGERRLVVGVARNTVWRGWAERAAPVLYVALAPTDYRGAISLVVATIAPPAPLVPVVGQTLHDLDPNLAPQTLMTMRTRLELPRWPSASASKFFGACGALALLLATIGLTAVLWHAVGQRTREFGVRIAVGATRTQLLRDVLASGVAIVAPGIVVGLVLGAFGARLLRTAIVGVDITSPSTYVAIALLQAVVALAACIAPARRAANVDPLTALRAE
jgi:predicted permease